MRTNAVNLLCGSGLVAQMPARNFRRHEKLPINEKAALAALAPWKVCGHWECGKSTGSLSVAFQFGVAASVGRAAVVLEKGRKGKIVFPAKCYNAAAGGCCWSPVQDLQALLRLIEGDASISVMLYNGADHFDPFVKAVTAHPARPANTELAARVPPGRAKRALHSTAAIATNGESKSCAPRVRAKRAPVVHAGCYDADALQPPVTTPMSRKAASKPAAALSGSTGMHSSPSLRSDELSDYEGYDSELEADYNANPAPITFDPPDDDDEAEAIIDDRIDADEAAVQMEAAASADSIWGDAMGDALEVTNNDLGLDPAALAVGAADDGEEDNMPQRHNSGSGDAAATASHRDAPTAGAPDRPLNLAKSKLADVGDGPYRNQGRAWPAGALYVLLSIVATGATSSARILSLSAEISDPEQLLHTPIEPFHAYVDIGKRSCEVSSLHGKSFAELQCEAAGDFAHVGASWL
eukprot:3603191-Prymnesium_polylepis.1